MRTLEALVLLVFAIAIAAPDASATPPVILSLSPPAVSGAGCCPQGSFEVILSGTGFRKCSSIVVVFDGRLHELLPTPDVTDCGVVRPPSVVSPRERLYGLLPPDGETISCPSRPDLVPMRQVSQTSYRHDSICDVPITVPASFCPFNATMIPNGGDPYDVTSGGAFSWINESEMRLFFAPEALPGPGACEDMFLYVCNDPGNGLNGEHTSNGALLRLEDTSPAPDLGNAVLAVRPPSSSDVVLSFAAAPGSTFRVFRDVDKRTLGGTPLTPDTTATSFVDGGAILRASDDYYRVKGVSCSGIAGP